ncbi:MAG TPA: MEDS domain-containing protein, partial [Candidatus Saccharimonadales bacterium]|nr:MEDS domain-containing protein [Candidatus Saccharimonadales bacterium]
MRSPGSLPEHIVQFHDGPATLAHRLAEFVAQGFARGEAVVVIATAEHRMATEGRLVALGVDLGAAAAEGRYLPFDAREILERLLLDGRPDRARFEAAVGAVIEQVMRTHHQIRAFGEMVGLLWSDGQSEAAIALEDLWNEL